jgi:hypothetical protein
MKGLPVVGIRSVPFRSVIAGSGRVHVLSIICIRSNMQEFDIRKKIMVACLEKVVSALLFWY